MYIRKELKVIRVGAVCQIKDSPDPIFLERMLRITSVWRRKARQSEAFRDLRNKGRMVWRITGHSLLLISCISNLLLYLWSLFLPFIFFKMSCRPSSSGSKLNDATNSRTQRLCCIVLFHSIAVLSRHEHVWCGVCSLKRPEPRGEWEKMRGAWSRHGLRLAPGKAHWTRNHPRIAIFASGKAHQLIRPTFFSAPGDESPTPLVSDWFPKAAAAQQNSFNKLVRSVKRNHAANVKRVHTNTITQGPLKKHTSTQGKRSSLFKPFSLTSKTRLQQFNSSFLKNKKKKSLHNSSNYLGWNTLSPNYKTRYYTPWTFNTGQITPRVVLEGSFIFIFFYLFLLNLSKNHKMKILIFWTPDE